MGYHIDVDVLRYRFEELINKAFSKKVSNPESSNTENDTRLRNDENIKGLEDFNL